jgi:MOSC domain-containing protein YiiM
MNEPQIAALLLSRDRPDFYFCVLEGGEVEAGNEVRMRRRTSTSRIPYSREAASAKSQAILMWTADTPNFRYRSAQECLP